MENKNNNEKYLGSEVHKMVHENITVMKI